MKLRHKFNVAGVVALVVGCVSQALGFDIAPTEVDVIVTAVMTILALYGRFRDSK